MLFDSDISDESLLRLLEQLSALQKLNLRYVLVGDRLAQGLPRLSNLVFLSFDASRLTDVGLVDIGRLTSLRELSLVSTRISDVGLGHLTGLKNLEALNVVDTRATTKGREQIRNALPKCRIQ